MRKILYHGSLEIISTPMYVRERSIMTTDRAFIVRRVWSWRRSGRAPSGRTAM